MSLLSSTSRPVSMQELHEESARLDPKETLGRCVVAAYPFHLGSLSGNPKEIQNRWVSLSLFLHTSVPMPGRLAVEHAKASPKKAAAGFFETSGTCLEWYGTWQDEIHHEGIAFFETHP